MRTVPPGDSTPRGFTLIESMVVIAITAVLAALAFAIARSDRRNVQLRQAVGELALRITGLRSTALSEGATFVLVVVDAPGNDASGCGTLTTSACSQYFILAAPQADWTLNGFKLDDPAAKVSGVGSWPAATREPLPTGARFFEQDKYAAPPAPFDAAKIFDGRFKGSCGGRTCFAIGFGVNGTVYPVTPSGGASPGATGLGLVLASDAELESSGGDHRGIVVGFPSGVAKSWAY